MTELAAQPIRRATSFKENFAPSSFSARLRRSESSSAEPFGRMGTSYRQEVHYCIILCEVNRGQTMSSDSSARWDAISEVAQQLGIHIRPELTIQLEGFDSTPGLGYTFTKQLLARKHPFTALFAYNDIAAIGAIWAFHEAGLRVPEDISVVGFDDIPGAAYANPGLTTVRQPLVKMGQIAAQTVVDLIEGRGEYVPEIAIEPEFLIRQSTALAAALQSRHFSASTQPSQEGYLAK